MHPNAVYTSNTLTPEMINCHPNAWGMDWRRHTPRLKCTLQSVSVATLCTLISH